MEYPKISIVTITFNSEKTLEETIVSVLNQDYPNLEYIIIDGGSKDNTLEIVNKYRDKIAYMVSEPDNGISDAFNKGILASNGDIVGIINSDDVLLPDTLKTIAANYSDNVDIYSLNVIIWDEEKGIKVREYPDLVCDYKKIAHHTAHQGRFIKRTAYVKYGLYDVRLRYMMDYDLLVRYCKCGLVFKHINHDAALYRMGGATSDNESKKKNDFKIMVKNNGGSNFEFYYLWIYNMFRNWCKRIVIKVFGQNIRYSLRYKKIDNN